MFAVSGNDKDHEVHHSCWDEFGQKTVATTQRAGWQTNMFVVHCLGPQSQWFALGIGRWLLEHRMLNRTHIRRP